MLARFYGWSHEDLKNINNRDAEIYFECISIIDARENLNQMQLIDFPNMKKAARLKLHRRMVKQSQFPGSNKVISTNELAEKLARSMSGR